MPPFLQNSTFLCFFILQFIKYYCEVTGQTMSLLKQAENVFGSFELLNYLFL